MRQRTFARIRAHALSTPTVEVCGFVVVSADGYETTHQARNIHSDPANFFIVDPLDYVAAAGQIVAIYHSHPNSPADPTMADRSACSRTGFPWIIYSVPADNFASCEPDGVIAPLLGRQFAWGACDCGTLLQDYYRSKLQIELTYEPYPENFWEDPAHKPYLQKLQENGFEIVEKPRQHDVILMQLSADSPNHVAIYQEGGLILHHVQRRLSCRDVYGGYWRDVTRYILRHRSQL